VLNKVGDRVLNMSNGELAIVDMARTPMREFDVDEEEKVLSDVMKFVSRAMGLGVITLGDD